MLQLKQTYVLYDGYWLRYVQAISNKGLLFRADEDTQLYAWADASFASREDSRSQSWYCFSIGRDNASFHARSSKQLIVTLSSTESEYVALFACATEVVFLRRLLQELGFDQGPAIVFWDIMSKIRWVRGQENFHKTNIYWCNITSLGSLLLMTLFNSTIFRLKTCVLTFRRSP